MKFISQYFLTYRYRLSEITLGILYSSSKWVVTSFTECDDSIKSAISSGDKFIWNLLNSFNIFEEENDCNTSFSCTVNIEIISKFHLDIN